jgi:rhodanese-related sulfurtransferase
MWLIFVTAFLTASSMAPALISPPSICAIGIRKGQQLIAVRDQQEQVGTHLPQGIGKAQCGHADSLRHPHVRIGTQKALDARINSESILFNLLHSVPKFRRQVRSDHDDAQIDFRVRGEVAPRPVEVGIVSAGSCKDSDFSGHA